MAGDRNVRIGLCLAKVETTIGTDAVPTATLNSLLITDPLPDPGGTFAVKTERPKAITGYIQPLPQLIMQGRYATWPLKCQARGTRDGLKYQASDLPDFDPLMQAAGLSSTVGGGVGTETVAYAPLSTGLKTTTLYYYVDGKFSKLLGASVSSVSMDLSSGGPLMLDFTVEGLYQGQVDQAFAGPGTFGSTIPPTIDNAAFSLFGYSGGIVRSLKIHIANETTGARLALSSATGIVAPRVRSRKIEFTCVIENELQATKDFEAVQIANTLGTISWTQSGTQYNKIAFTAPAAQIHDVKYGNDKLTEIATITGQLFDSAGNDAFTLTFS